MGQVTAGTVVINLRANLAEFKSGMQDASGTASKAAKDMAGSMEYSMREARGSLKLVEEEFGVHMPRELNTLLASIPGLGAAFSAMLPLVGVVAAISIISELIKKHKEEQKALAEVALLWGETGSIAQKSNNDTAIALLEVQKQTDELSHNHIAVLKDELKLLNLTTLKNLGKEFEGITKEADKTFLALQKGETSFWFGGQWNSAAEQVKKDLDLWNQKLEKITRTASNEDIGKAVQQQLSDVTAALVRERELAGKEEGHKDRIPALERERDVIQAQADVYANLNKEEAANAGLDKKRTGLEVSGDANKIKEAVIAGNKEMQDAEVARVFSAIALSRQESLSVVEASLETARKKHQIDLADRESKLSILAQETQDELDASNHVFTNANDAMQKKLAILKKDPTKNASEIAALDAQMESLATKHETEKNNIVRKGVAERSRTIREFADEDIANADRDAKESERASRELLGFEDEMAKLKADAADQAAQHQLAMHNSSKRQELEADKKSENDKYDAQVSAYQKELAALDKNDADYAAKVTAADHKMELEAQAHQNKLTKIEDKAAEERKTHVLALETQIRNGIAESAAKAIVEQQNMAQAMKRLGEQMLEEEISLMIRRALMEDKDKLNDAKHNARKAYKSVMDTALPFPAKEIIAGVEAAVVFAATMAFEQGGIAPENAIGLFQKEEMVLPPYISHGLQDMIKNGNHLAAPYSDGKSTGSGGDTHNHNYNIDARGADSGVEQRIHRAMRTYEDRAVSRSIAATADRSGRRR